MKRLLPLATVIILVLAMAMVLTSCSGNITVPEVIPPPPPPEATPAPMHEPTPEPTPEPTSEPTPEPEVIEEIMEPPIIRGSWDGNTYSSEYLGFQFIVPDDWKIDSFDEVLAGLDLPDDILKAISDGKIPQEFWDLHNSTLELMVWDMFGEAMGIPTIMIVFSRLDNIDGSLLAHVQSEDARTNYTLSDEVLELGNFQWYELLDSGGFALIWYESFRILYAQDTDNGLLIRIDIYAPDTYPGTQGDPLKASDLFLSWFTPYP